MTKGNKQEFVKSEWFSKDTQEPVDLLVSALHSQTNLEKLVLEHCEFSDDHKREILRALAGR